MNPIHSLRAFICIPLLGSLAAASSMAQSAPTNSGAPASASAGQNEEVILLDPYTVPAGSSAGYEATNTLTATRIPTAIFDLPLPIYASTSEFLEDTDNESRLDNIYKYTPGLEGDPRTSNTSSGLFGSNLGTARGFPISAVMEDGLPRYGNFDLRDSLQIEVLEGPESVFFGSAQPGGTLNIISPRPAFSTFGSVTAEYGTFATSSWATKQQTPDGEEGDFVYNTHIGDVAAFRIFAFDSNRNWWHNNEYYHQRGLTPSLILKPLPKLEIYTKLEYELTLSNPAGASPASNSELLAGYANPDPKVLAANGLTAAQYRSNIFSGGSNFEIYELNTYGYNAATNNALGLWRTEAMGDVVFPASSPFSQPSFSFQSPSNFYNTNSIISTTTVTYEAADWLTLRYAFLYDDENVNYIEISETIPNADGLTANVGTSQGAATTDLYRYDQINALLKGTIWGLKNNLVLGYDHDDHWNYTVSRNYNYNLYPYTAYAPINGVLTPVTGQSVFTYWDPSLYPDAPSLALVQSGWQPPSQEYDRYGAEYVNWQGEYTLAGHRIIPTAGYRHESTDSTLISTADAYSYEKTSGNSYVLGLTVGLTEDLNLYVSHSTNWLPNVGYTESGVGVDKNLQGQVVSGLNEGSTPLANQTGWGTDAGIKFKLLDGRLSGSFGWFAVARSNIEVQNSAAQAADPRDNSDGSFYFPNASGTLQLVNASFQPVVYETTSGEEENQGLETQVFYQLTPNDQIMVSLASIYSSRVVNDIAYSDPYPATAASVLNGQILLSRRLAESPAWQGGIFNKYAFSSGVLKGSWIGAGLHGMTSTMPRSDDSQDSTWFHKGFAVVDLSVGYADKLFGRPTEYSLAVSNLFDRIYDYGNFGYGDPRELNFSVKTRF